MSITDNAVYVDGHRTDNPPSLELTLETMQACDGIGWIDLLQPSAAEIRAVADELGLHELAVDDAVNAHQRSKLERYDDVLFVVLHPARYLDSPEQVEFSELHVFVGPRFVVSVRRDEFPHVSPVRRALEARPDRLRLGPLAILHALLDRVVDEYAPVVAGLENDIDEIEDQLFSRDPEVSRRMYELSREVIRLQRATRPLVQIVRTLETGRVFDLAPGAGAAVTEDGGAGMDVELERAFRDVLDHAIRYAERADEFRAVLDNALTVHATLVAQEQNEEVRHMTEASLKQAEAAKKISSWAAIFFAPTLVAGIYGMNFTHMPELHWLFGYPFALLLMVVAAFGLYSIFKRVDWL
ncbi:magnesium and cobalt transport protein CorA [Xylanimonas protaetiae]|uniref:Magnesium and cobalt transport protein CorA n=1 Tax=Xylanimonas protaetiae TaxID=2509457 RepID=A0A4P6F3T3_9MICO|nr:magnesium and cobalt transport protein CorA [Xylanimonas protaetiae]QAY69333.1 magnesium and cobalt transport protein CorA [Xylanimonas protaetiae]